MRNEWHEVKEICIRFGSTGMEFTSVNTQLLYSSHNI